MVGCTPCFEDGPLGSQECKIHVARRRVKKRHCGYGLVVRASPRIGELKILAYAAGVISEPKLVLRWDTGLQPPSLTTGLVDIALILFFLLCTLPWAYLHEMLTAQ